MSASRRFVAIGVPEHVRAGLEPPVAAVIGGASTLRPTRPEGWHVTLAFTGRVADRSSPELAAAVAAGVTDWVSRAGDTTLRLRIGAPGTFGDRVLYLEVVDEPAGSLAALATGVRARMEAGGFGVTDTPMRPHVTLARARRTGRSAEIAMSSRHLAGKLADRDLDTEWTVPGVEVWRTRLGDGPARYVAEASVAFDDSA